MRKLDRLALAVLIIPLLAQVIQAGQGIIGNLVNLGQVGGTNTATGAGASSAGTLRVILASDSPAGNVTNAGTFSVQNTAATPAGSNLIGKVGIDQTTPGTTNKVSIGTDGTVSIAASQTIAVTNAGTFATQATLAAETTKVIGTVNIASGQSIATTQPTVSAPTITKVGATTTSAQLIAANATRKGIEVDCDCANTDNTAINFGASAAVYASHKVLTPCSNWQPPPGVVVTSAIQIISNTGTQNCRAIEYP